jgi:hypothetical protein
MKYPVIAMCLLLIGALSCTTLGCTTGKQTLNILPEDCCGVWVNMSYNTLEKKAAKIIYYPDMTWDAFQADSSIRPMWRGTISIMEKWRDHDGCCWYKITTNQLGFDIIVYELWRLSEKGTVLEGVWSVGYIPREIDPDDESYSIYYKFDSPIYRVKAAY